MIESTSKWQKKPRYHCDVCGKKVHQITMILEKGDGWPHFVCSNCKGSTDFEIDRLFRKVYG